MTLRPSRVASCTLLLGSLLIAHAQTDAPHQRRAKQPTATLTPADEGHFREALHAYDRGDLSRAEQMLGPLAARFPRHAQIQAAEGSVLLETGEIDRGIPFLERSLSIDAANQQVAINLGVAYIKAGRPQQAIPLLQASCRLSPPAGCPALAQAQIATRQYLQAAQTYQLLANDGSADLPELRHDWALALLHANKPGDALNVLKAAPQLQADAGLQELTGEAEEKTGHFEKAFAAFQRAATLDPSEANLFHYGNELLQHWSFPAAIDIFQFALSRFPDSEQLRAGLGVAYFGNNDFTHAADIFAQQLTRAPENTEAADLLGRSCSAVGSSTPAACSGLLAFAHRHPANGAASLYAAVTLMQQPLTDNTSREAEDLLRAALAAKPTLAEAWYQLAVLQQTNNDWNGSAASLAKAIALRANYAEAHYRLSRAYAHTGRRQDAQQEIALQQKYAASTKEDERRHMQEVMTFLTTSN